VRSERSRVSAGITPHSGQAYSKAKSDSRSRGRFAAWNHIGDRCRPEQRASSQKDRSSTSGVARASERVTASKADEEGGIAQEGGEGGGQEWPAPPGAARLSAEVSEIGDKGGFIGANGYVVTVTERQAEGLVLRDKDGTTGFVEWRRLQDSTTGRFLLGHGHALTIDAAQGITSQEHINALPRGTGGVTSFKGYVAESRARGTSWTMVAEAATFEAIRRGKALGDTTPITSDDLWRKVGEDLSQKPYKPLGVDLLREAREAREAAVDTFIRFEQRVQMDEVRGRDFGREARLHRQAEAVRSELPRLMEALDTVIQEFRGGAVTAAEKHLRGIRIEAEVSRRGINQAAAPAKPETSGPGI
jgi:hypothetical protein